MEVSAVPDALSITACKLSCPAPSQLQCYTVGLPFRTAAKGIILNYPCLSSKSIRRQGSICCGCGVVRMFIYCPCQVIFVIFNDAGVQANELNRTRFPLVPRNIQPINVRFWTQASHLQVYLPWVLTSTCDWVNRGRVTQIVSPIPPHWHHDPTVFFSAPISDTNTCVHYFTRILIHPLSLLSIVTEKHTSNKHLNNLKCVYLNGIQNAAPKTSGYNVLLTGSMVVL